MKSGVHTLKKAVAVLGKRALPSQRTALGRALRERRQSLIDHLGGDPSVAQAELIDLAVTTKMQLDSVDAYIFTLPSPVDKRHRRLWPVMRERQSLAAQYQSLLRDLGLERRAKPVPDLAAYLAARETAPPPTPPAPSGTMAGTADHRGPEQP
jgi:hypothetical protein